MKLNILTVTAIGLLMSFSTASFAKQANTAAIDAQLEKVSADLNRYGKQLEKDPTNEKILKKMERSAAEMQRLFRAKAEAGGVDFDTFEQDLNAGLLAGAKTTNEALIKNLPAKAKKKAQQQIDIMYKNAQVLAKNPNDKAAKRKFERAEEQLEDIFERHGADLYLGDAMLAGDLSKEQQAEAKKLIETMQKNAQILSQNPNDKRAKRAFERAEDSLEKTADTNAEVSSLDVAAEMVQSLPAKKRAQAEKYMQQMRKNAAILAKEPNNKRAQKAYERAEDKFDDLLEDAGFDFDDDNDDD